MSNWQEFCTDYFSNLWISKKCQIDSSFLLIWFTSRAREEKKFANFFGNFSNKSEKLCLWSEAGFVLENCGLLEKIRENAAVFAICQFISSIWPIWREKFVEQSWLENNRENAAVAAIWHFITSIWRENFVEQSWLEKIRENAAISAIWQLISSV